MHNDTEHRAVCLVRLLNAAELKMYDCKLMRSVSVSSGNSDTSRSNVASG